MKGIVYKKKGIIIKIPHKPVVDLDALPFPKRDITKHCKKLLLLGMDEASGIHTHMTYYGH